MPQPSQGQAHHGFLRKINGKRGEIVTSLPGVAPASEEGNFSFPLIGRRSEKLHNGGTQAENPLSCRVLRG